LDFKLDIFKHSDFDTVRKELYERLENNYAHLFPASKSAKILLKPNFNSNMNALTGNTTDLRILSAVVVFLKEKGYTNILIGEGTNSGFYRNKIGVSTRLKGDQLARYYGVEMMDFNYAEPHEITFDKNVKASVAKEAVEADLFINLPKLKTHFENGMTVCLKNMMGCLIGQENKKKVHDNLPENILRINQAIKPHLHIVDGLIAMEGLGPTRGTPLRMDTIVIGEDPYLIDLACARLACFDHRAVRTLALAEEKGMLTAAHHDFINALDLAGFQKKFAPPKAGPLATFIHSPKRQKFFLKIRKTPFFTYLAATDWFGRLLFLTGLRQDVFLKEEMTIKGLAHDQKACVSCGACRDVCPLDRPLPEGLNQPAENCIHCLYCYAVCPQQAISVDGELGFFEEQLKQYDHLIRKLYQ